jgi:hypothetical protein
MLKVWREYVNFFTCGLALGTLMLVVHQGVH